MEFYYTYMFTNLFSRVSTVLLALSLVFHLTTINTEQVHSVFNWNLLRLPAEPTFKFLGHGQSKGSPQIFLLVSQPWQLVTGMTPALRWSRLQTRSLPATQPIRHVSMLGVRRVARSDRIFRSTGNVTPTTGSFPGPKRRWQCLRSSPTRPAAKQQATATATSPAQPPAQPPRQNRRGRGGRRAN